MPDCNFDTLIKATAIACDSYREAQAEITGWLDLAPDHVDTEQILGLHRSDTRMTPLLAEHLTDAEKSALSWAYLDKQFVVKTYKDMAGINGIISGWDDATPANDAARHAQLYEAMQSLDRFGLVEGYYERSTVPSRERIIETIKNDDGTFYKLPDTGWRYRITDAGRKVLHTNRALIYHCCDACVRLFCVCNEKTYCAEHGGSCHGTHD